MTATREEISSWYDRGVRLGATHMIVACDTFDHDNYPVYVVVKDDYPEDEPPTAIGELTAARSSRDVANKFSGKNMQTVDEVYDLSMDKASQLAERRAFNY